MLIMIFQISQLVLDLIIFQIFALCSCLHVNDSYRILVDCSWHGLACFLNSLYAWSH